MTYPIWRPSAQRARRRQQLAAIPADRMPTGSIRPTTESLYRWSVEQQRRVLAKHSGSFSGIRASTPYRSVVTGPRTHARRPLVRRRAAELRRESAVPRVLGERRVVFYSERGDRIDIELGRSCAARSASLARALESLPASAWGIGSSGLLPNRPEAVVAMLATASIGAQSGRPVRRISASMPCSTGSGRSAPKSCSRPMVISTTARPSTVCPRSVEVVEPARQHLKAVVVVGYVDPEPDLAA